MDKYRFSKSYYDITDPVVIKGEDIENGVQVEIIETFSIGGTDNETVVRIEDDHGNVVSTYKSSLVRIKDKFQ